MSRTSVRLAIAAALVLMAAWPVARVARGDGPKDHNHSDHGHSDHEHNEEVRGAVGHLHAPVPAEYRGAYLPSAAWTDPRMIARGREIYAARCAVCHGEEGAGDGPAARGLPIKPPDLRDARMVGEMAGNYWFWRISEGGLVEPFKSQGSIMPAWKDELSVEDRWAVIAYQHTFSGHRGPHVTSEHPQMLSPAHASHGTSPAHAGGTPGAASQSSTPTGGTSTMPPGSSQHKH